MRLAQAEQAESIRRELAAAQPDAYRADWATSLGNLGNRLSEVGQYDEALAQAEQAESILRELAAARPDAYFADWANGLGNLSHCLIAIGNQEEALAAAKEANAIYTRLAALRSGQRRFATELGWVRTLSAEALMLTAHRHAAIGQAELALVAFDTVAGIRPGDVAPKYAVALAILVLQREDASDTRVQLARKAFELIAPYFHRRGLGLRREMKLVISALRATEQPVPADILKVLDENGLH